MRLCILALLFILIAPTIAPTQAWSEQHITAEQAVVTWLAALDRGEYSATWNRTAPIFQSQLSEKSWAKMAAQARKPFGEALSRELVTAAYKNELPGVPPGDYVVFQFRTKFSEQREAVETITPRLVGGRWLVSGYYIR